MAMVAPAAAGTAPASGKLLEPEKSQGSFLARIFHREENDTEKQKKIIQIIKDNLPPHLREMITSDKQVVTASGKINPVFYEEVVESRPDTEIVPLGNGISVIEQPIRNSKHKKDMFTLK